ncbi:hypothetical protein AB0F46_01635 [Streptomyces sp. NPDC026665]|uniref:hypothetical protein n=1 Tax=Streptomyces sp. NPDC026665 TaxID=3154798 RepID=UPI0033FAC2BF
MRIGHIAKAIVSGIAAGAAAAGTAVQDGIITGPEGLTIVLAVLAGLGLTWAVPNKQQPDA